MLAPVALLTSILSSDIIPLLLFLKAQLSGRLFLGKEKIISKEIRRHIPLEVESRPQFRPQFSHQGGRLTCSKESRSPED